MADENFKDLIYGMQRSGKSVGMAYATAPIPGLKSCGVMYVMDPELAKGFAAAIEMAGTWPDHTEGVGDAGTPAFPKTGDK